MNQNQTVFIVDAGNTSLKLGVFIAGNLEKVLRFDYNSWDSFVKIHKEHLKPPIFLSSVLSEKATKSIMTRFEAIQLFTRSNHLPIEIEYLSNTLGMDRICNAVAAHHISKSNSVVIDIGTCIKFDYTNKDGVYFGGSISPGINLRYKSMNDYTGNLPLLDLKTKADLIGNSTNNSIHSGVMNGIQAEIEQFINRYEQEISNLTFFVTGGDAEYFDFPLKNNIFVDENLTLKGLYIIYNLNVK